MGSSRYLLRRGPRWYLRLHVPEKLKAVLTGRKAAVMR